MHQRTKPQRDLLKVIEDLCGKFGRSPTTYEIAHELGIAQSSVHQAVESAVKRGDIIKEDRKPRSIKVCRSES